MKNPNPMPTDIKGTVIPSCSQIVAIDTISITTSGYVAITVPNDKYCKSIFLKTRNDNDWRLATSSSPSKYIKFTTSISLDLVLKENQTFAYVRADTTNDTLEVLYID